MNWYENIGSNISIDTRAAQIKTSLHGTAPNVLVCVVKRDQIYFE